jgi:hypothetical protein
MVLGKSTVNAAVSFDDKMIDGGGTIYRYVAGSIFNLVSLSLLLCIFGLLESLLVTCTNCWNNVEVESHESKFGKWKDTLSL